MAVVLLAMWFRRKVLPYIRNNIRERVKKTLVRGLGGLVKKKKAAKDEAVKNEAATKLGAGLRGMNDRRKVMRMKDEAVLQNKGATKIQSAYRGKRGRELAQKLLVKRVAAAFSKKYEKASVVQRALLRWLNYKRGQKELERKRLERQREKETRDKQAAAAAKVQAASASEWQNFHDTKALLLPAAKPHSKDCVGYWFALGGTTQDEPPRPGLVLGCQRDLRLVTVLFNDGRSRSKADDITTDIPLDHPKVCLAMLILVCRVKAEFTEMINHNQIIN